MQITDGRELIFPAQYADRGYPHDVWSRLRRESPVHHCSPPGYGSFWAITRHADICDISKRPDAFVNSRGIVVLDDDQARMRESDESGLAGMKTIIEMDPPTHRTFRKVASGWFTPRSLARLESAVDESARSLVDSLAADGDGECDFVTRVAVAHPLRILSQALGVPREDEALILRLTNELFSGDDPDSSARGPARSGSSRSAWSSSTTSRRSSPIAGRIRAKISPRCSRTDPSTARRWGRWRRSATT